MNKITATSEAQTTTEIKNRIAEDMNKELIKTQQKIGIVKNYVIGYKKDIKNIHKAIKKIQDIIGMEIYTIEDSMYENMNFLKTSEIDAIQSSIDRDMIKIKIHTTELKKLQKAIKALTE